MSDFNPMHLYTHQSVLPEAHWLIIRTERYQIMGFRNSERILSEIQLNLAKFRNEMEDHKRKIDL